MTCAAAVDERLITVREAASYLAVSRQTIHRWAGEDGWGVFGRDARGRLWFRLEDVLRSFHRRRGDVDGAA